MLAQYRQAIEKYRQRVFSYAYYSLRGREDAEDITQDVFIRLWQHWQKVDPERMGAWLMRVAHNTVIDHVRKHKGEKLRVELKQNLEDTIAVSNFSLEGEEFRQQLESVISELAEPYRSIVIMRDIQGMSYSEIEQTLDLSQSQVKVYLHRSRRQLRENPLLRQLATEHAVLEPEAEESGKESHKENSSGAVPGPDTEQDRKQDKNHDRNHDEGLSHV